jgi:uncharacterized protein YjbI with pentapeptide repeats
MGTNRNRRSLPKLPATLSDVNSFEGNLAGVRMIGAISSLLDGVTIEQSVLDGCELGSCNARSMKLYDVVLNHCDCANADLHHAVFDRTEVQNSKMTGACLLEARIKDTLFASCKCDYALFRMARVSFSEFVECNLREADFYGTNLSGTVFTNCDLRNAEFSGASLAKTDIRGCQIEGIKVNAEAVKGLIIDPSQAIYFMYLLGIKVML